MTRKDELEVLIKHQRTLTKDSVKRLDATNFDPWDDSYITEARKQLTQLENMINEYKTIVGK